MWEPFTERARRIIVTAQEIAKNFDNNFLDAEHIVVAIVEEGHNGASDAVSSSGVTEEQVVAVAKAVISSAGIENRGEMIFTPRAKQVIDLAFQEARDLQNNYIGVEHLMLGYLRESENGSELLSKLNLQPEQLRAKILKELKPGSKVHAPASLDDLFERAQTLLETEELWQRLHSAVEFEDVGGALMYALLIARRSGMSSAATAQRLQKLIDDLPG